MQNSAVFKAVQSPTSAHYSRTPSDTIWIIIMTFCLSTRLCYTHCRVRVTRAARLMEYNIYTSQTSRTLYFVSRISIYASRFAQVWLMSHISRKPLSFIDNDRNRTTETECWFLFILSISHVCRIVFAVVAKHKRIRTRAYSMVAFERTSIVCDCKAD